MLLNIYFYLSQGMTTRERFELRMLKNGAMNQPVFILNISKNNYLFIRFCYFLKLISQY